MRASSLKTALLVSVASVVACSGLLICVLLTNRYSANLLDTAHVRAEAVAKKLALDLTDLILINDLVAIQKAMDDQMVSDTDVAYLFITKDGQVLAHTFKEGIPAGLIGLNVVSEGKDLNTHKVVSETGDRYLDVAMPIFDGRAGTLRIGLSQASFQRQIAILWVQMALLTLGVLGVAMIAAAVLIKYLLTPLTKLQEAVTQIDESQLDARIGIRGRKEVNRLTEAFNSMLGRLQGTMNRLRQSNAEMDAKNQALDRAHKQLQASLTISQQVAALSCLNDIGVHLIHTLESIVPCRHMVICIIDEERKALLSLSENGQTPIYHDTLEPFIEGVESVGTFGFIATDTVVGLPARKKLKSAQKLAVFPFRFENRLLGALIVGCSGDCLCIRAELKVIGVLLNQSAGALNRALSSERQSCTLRTRVETMAAYGDIIGKDPKMQVVYQLIEDVAPTDATVLIMGESGTGKELVAKAIHNASERRNKPFVIINCAAYPATLIESELFGHEKGAFTGANRRKAGRFEQAHGGTVFLDEIGEITPTAQIKLLRVLQNHTIERIGGTSTIRIDVRILAATNRDLEAEVKTGHFREDLFYRINVIPIHLPPLRERRNDIPLIAHHFLNRFALEQEKPLNSIGEEAMRLLFDHGWPGNVRELENSVEHAAVLAKSDTIQPIDLPSALRSAPRSATGLVPTAPTITDSEAQLIREALDDCGGNKSAAAARLGISRSTLYEKLKKHRIEVPTMH